MNAEQRFLSEGADYFGNRLIYKNQDVGYKSSSGLSLNDHGEDVLKVLESITDVVPREPRKRTKVAAPSASIDDLLDAE